jgi:hypothetical protein
VSLEIDDADLQNARPREQMRDDVGHDAALIRLRPAGRRDGGLRDLRAPRELRMRSRSFVWGRTELPTSRLHGAPEWKIET